MTTGGGPGERVKMSGENGAWLVARQIKEVTVAVGDALESITGHPVPFALVCWGDPLLHGTVIGTNRPEPEALEVLTGLVDTLQMKLAFEDAEESAPKRRHLDSLPARH